MRRTVIFGICMLLFAAPAPAQRRAVRHPSAFPNPRSVLWIAAHPDDEAVAAPLLSLWCREQRAACTFLVLTRGESGACLLPGGCPPDVATVRAAEAGAAAQYFQANSIHLTLPDGGGAMQPQWPPELAETIARYIEAVRPELILTFDPRHGTTCHPDHREVGRLVLEAARRLTFAPEVYLLETLVTRTPGLPVLRIASASPHALRFDAASRWPEVARNMSFHPSQFDVNLTVAARNVPASERAVYLAPAETILGHPVAGCAP
ncbi:MAG TPA: PIG-L family deacetylase [Thermoanaerobaculia bacterium]